MPFDGSKIPGREGRTWRHNSAEFILFPSLNDTRWLFLRVIGEVLLIAQSLLDKLEESAALNPMWKDLPCTESQNRWRLVVAGLRLRLLVA